MKKFEVRLVYFKASVNAGFVFPLLSGDDFPVSDKKNYSKPTAPTFRRSFIL